MVTIVGIYTRKLIDEKNRPNLPRSLDISKLNQAQQNSLEQNRFSIQEFKAWEKPIHMATEHGSRRDIGYVKKMWVDDNNNPYLEAEIENKIVGHNVKNGYYKGLSMKGSRKILDGGRVSFMDIEEISLVKQPFFPECKITTVCSKNISKKNIYSQKKEDKRNKTILFTIASLKMSEKSNKESKEVSNEQSNDKMVDDSDNKKEEYFQMTKKQYERFQSLLKKEENEIKEYGELGEKELTEDFGEEEIKKLKESGNYVIMSRVYKNPDAKKMKQYWRETKKREREEKLLKKQQLEKNRKRGRENSNDDKRILKKRMTKKLNPPSSFTNNLGKYGTIISTKASHTIISDNTSALRDLELSLMSGTPLDGTSYGKYYK